MAFEESQYRPITTETDHPSEHLFEDKRTAQGDLCRLQLLHTPPKILQERVNLRPECTILPQEIRELRRVPRYRNHLVQTSVKMQNKMSGLLMEVWAGFEIFQESQKRLILSLRTDALIRERVCRLMTIAGVGEVTALIWTLEIGDPLRFSSIRQAISNCGLCSSLRESAGKEHRSPISKKRNKHLQTILVEAGRVNPKLNRLPRSLKVRGWRETYPALSAANGCLVA